MLNSQIQIHRILRFGAKSTKKQRKPGGGQTGLGNQEKHQHPERKTAEYHSSSVAPDFHPNFLWYEEFVHNNFIFVENPSHSS